MRGAQCDPLKLRDSLTDVKCSFIVLHAFQNNHTGGKKAVSCDVMVVMNSFSSQPESFKMATMNLFWKF